MEENMQMIPFIAYEANAARAEQREKLAAEQAERREKRDFVIKIILIAVIVISNGWHIWYESQFEKVAETTETYEVKQESENNNSSIINGGEIVNGKTDN